MERMHTHDTAMVQYDTGMVRVTVMGQHCQVGEELLGRRVLEAALAIAPARLRASEALLAVAV